MNYLREINAFYDLMERDPLSASAVTLWHALMHMNNKAMWADSFTVPGVVLKIKSGLTDSSFKRARKELVDAGFIDYEPSQQRKAPTYRMKSLCQESSWAAPPSSTSECTDSTMLPTDGQTIESSLEMESEIIDDVQGRPLAKDELKCTEPNDFVPGTHQFYHDSNDTTPNASHDEGVILSENMNREARPIPTHEANQSTTSQHVDSTLNHNMNHVADPITDHHSNHCTNRNEAPLYKLNINQKRQNKTPSAAAASHALTFYEENFGELGPFISNGIHHWSEQLGDELVIKAMTRALEHGVKKWKYIDTILRSWRDNGITTLEDVRLEELAFKGRKKRSERAVLNKTLEADRNIPDWFEERKVQHARHHEMIRQAREKELERVKDPKYAEQTRRELEVMLKGSGVS